MIKPFIWHANWMLNKISELTNMKVYGIEYIPFVIVVRDEATPTTINHETIHFWQMMETLIVGYYLIYIGHYLHLRINYDHKTAYRNICLEKEAYINHSNLSYIKIRKLWAWAR